VAAAQRASPCHAAAPWLTSDDLGYSRKLKGVSSVSATCATTANYQNIGVDGATVKDLVSFANALNRNRTAGLDVKPLMLSKGAPTLQSLRRLLVKQFVVSSPSLLLLYIDAVG
jgi:hypothetical protein